MIGRRFQRKVEEEHQVGPKGFDDYEVRLGDLMRGERATMGKSLLDVQRDLRIKASYIAAIENADHSAFDTPGFVAGYVRSYARYLGMDPDETFQTFCRESGFVPPTGGALQPSASRSKPGVATGGGKGAAKADPLLSARTTFVPEPESFLEQIEPRAIGSLLVLLALIAGIGYGGWTVLKEIQQVQFEPVEQAPVVLADLDPLDEATAGVAEDKEDPARAESLDRLYRPQALDVPVLVSRDAPISTLDPREVGIFRTPDLPKVDPVSEPGPVAAVEEGAQPVPQVVETAAPVLRMVAVRPSWVRVRAADGTVIFEGIMESGQTYDVPITEEPPVLRAGESGAIYFAVNGTHYGPVGQPGTVTSNLPLSIEAVTDRFQVADLEQDRDLARLVAEAEIDPAPAE